MTDYILSSAGSTFIENINADGKVGIQDIANGAVTADKIALNAIVADNISAEAVKSRHITDGNVTNAKIAGGAVTADKIAERAVTPAKLSFETFTKTEVNNGFCNALKKTAANVLGSSLTVTDGIAGTALTSLKLTGYCRQSRVPSLTQRVEISFNSRSYLSYNSTIYGDNTTVARAKAKYGLGDIKDEYDFVSGTKIERLALKRLKGTSADGTWAMHGSPLDGKYCYKLQNADIAMLPTTYGNYVICTHFTNSGRSFYNASPDCGIGTVSCIATTTNAANKNALYFVVGSSIVGKNGITYDTTTLEGFLSWVAGQYAGYTLEVWYVKAVPIVTQNTDAEIMLAQTNTITAGGNGTFEITYNQDINKRIAELEAAIAALPAGI